MGNGQDYYGILRLHNKVGVLIECGFMSNADDMKVLVKSYKTIGKEIADGINNYVGGKVTNTNTNTNTSTTTTTATTKELQEKITTLEKKVSTLESEAKTKTTKITTLEMKCDYLTDKNKELTEKLNKALAFDVDANGVTNEADAIYLLKNIIDPEKYPIKK